MNRKQRRAAAASKQPSYPDMKGLGDLFETIKSLEEFAGLADKLKPQLEALDSVLSTLEDLSGELKQAQRWNSILEGELNLQRKVFMRLLATLTGTSGAVIESYEQDIVNEIEREYADQVARTEEESGTEAGDSPDA